MMEKRFNLGCVKWTEAGGKKFWKPIRKGDVFCSPGCGGGCLRKDYEFVVAKSKRLAVDLGPGWEPNVFENMGWYWTVENKKLHLSVYQNQNGKQTSAVLGDAFTGYGRTPEAAIRQAAMAAVPEYERLKAIVELAKTILDEKKGAKRK